jgi:hypothetical protein
MKISRLTHSDPLPLLRPHLLSMPQSSQTPPAGGQVFKRMSTWGTFLIQTITVTKSLTWQMELISPTLGYGLRICLLVYFCCFYVAQRWKCHLYQITYQTLQHTSELSISSATPLLVPHESHLSILCILSTRRWHWLFSNFVSVFTYQSCACLHNLCYI